MYNVFNLATQDCYMLLFCYLLFVRKYMGAELSFATPRAHEIVIFLLLLCSRNGLLLCDLLL